MKKGHPEFPPRWSTRKLLRVGFLLGLGRQSTNIAEVLNDGTSDATIRAVRRYARLSALVQRKHGRPGSTAAVIELTAYQGKRLSDLAAERGMTPEEWLRRIAVAAIEDDLFGAVVDE